MRVATEDVAFALLDIGLHRYYFMDQFRYEAICRREPSNRQGRRLLHTDEGDRASACKADRTGLVGLVALDDAHGP